MFLFSNPGFVILVLSLYSFVDSTQDQSELNVLKWMCADESCSVPIANAVVTRPYTHPDHHRKIAVKNGDELKILRRTPPGSKQKLLYVESMVSKKRGLLSEKFVKELKTLVESNQLIETDVGIPSDTPPTPAVNPSNVKPSSPMTVIDGTTLVDGGYDYPLPHTSFEPTQVPGSPSESIVQITTPPSIPASQRSEDGESVGDNFTSSSKPVPNDPGKDSDMTSAPSGAAPTPEETINVKGRGISSTPASTIARVDSLATHVPKHTMPDSPSQTSAEKMPEDDEAPPDASGPGGIFQGVASLFYSLGNAEEEKSETSDDSFSSSLSRGPNARTDEQVKETVEDLQAGGTKHKSKRASAEPKALDGLATKHIEKAGHGEETSAGPVVSAKQFEKTTAQDEDRSKEGDVPNDNSAHAGPQSKTKVDPAVSELDTDQAEQEPPGSAEKSGKEDSSNEVDNVVAGPATTGVNISEPAVPEKQSDKEIKENAISKKPGSGTIDVIPTQIIPHTTVSSKVFGEQPEKTTQVPPVNANQPYVDLTTVPDLKKPLESNQSNEDTGRIEEVTSNSSVSPEKKIEHTQETRVSMSSSHKTDKIAIRVDRSKTQIKVKSKKVTDDSESSPEDTNESADVEESRVTSEDDSQSFEAQSAESVPQTTTPSPSGAQSSDMAQKQTDSGVQGERNSTGPVSKVVDNSEGGRVTSEDAPKSVEAKSTESVPQTTTPSPSGAQSSDMAQNPSRVTIEDASKSVEDQSAESVPQTTTPSPSGMSNWGFVDPRKMNPEEYARPEEPILGAPSQRSSSVGGDSQWTHEPASIPILPQSSPSSPVVEDTSSHSSPIERPPMDQPLEILEEPTQSDSSDWLSGISSVFGSLQDMFSGGSLPVVPPAIQVDEQSQSRHVDSSPTEEQNSNADSSVLEYYDSIPTKTVILMVVTAGAVVVFSLGYYFLENQQRDVELVTKYNELVGKLFIEQKEKETLLEQLASSNESITQSSFDREKYDDEIRNLNALVQKYKEEKVAHEEKEKDANRRRIISEKNYNDLLKTLSERKQKGERSTLSAEVKNLKDRIEADEINIASLKEQLLEKKNEIKSLNVKISDLCEANQQLERNVEKAVSEVHNNAKNYQESISTLNETIEENTASLVKLEAECTRLKKEKESLAVEKELAESSLQKFHQLTPSNALTEWLDAKDVRVALLASEKKVKTLSEQHETLLREKTQLEAKFKSMKLDLEQLNENYEKAERDKIDALTKLQVLSDYFKEKESQLQEELGSKEALWLQKQSDDRSIYEQMRALREENASFKNQNETLKREILEQEASYKKLIASANEKADENWVALRHTERRLKEAQMEASQLRSRLSTMGASNDNPADKVKGEVNGDLPSFGSATSPQFMLYPHEFMPPPPLPTAAQSRPPPLGRISSPPPVDFVPPPPLVPFESLFLPPSPPPPVPHAMMNITHKPQPLDGAHHRTQKDSQSSNHSSESTPDKPRRNKR